MFDAVPWPELRATRSLVAGAHDHAVARLLRAAGAATVVTCEPDDLHDLAEREPGFDVVVLVDVLVDVDDPSGLLVEAAAVCTGVLVSIEPLDPVQSIVRRGRAFTRPDPTGRRRRRINGSAHRGLLASATARLEAVSRPFLLPGTVPRLERALGALLARDFRPGELHRALVARPTILSRRT